jgi:hypothetical protein
MLHTGRLKTFLSAGRAEDTQLGGKRQEGKIGLIPGQPLDNFNYFHAGLTFWPLVFLSTGNLAGITTGTVLIINKQAVSFTSRHF